MNNERKSSSEQVVDIHQQTSAFADEKSFKKLLTSCSSSDNIYLADARESEQQRPDKRSEKLDN